MQFSGNGAIEMSTARTEVAIARLPQGEIERAATVMAGAFATDPLGLYLLPDPRHRLASHVLVLARSTAPQPPLRTQLHHRARNLGSGQLAASQCTVRSTLDAVAADLPGLVSCWLAEYLPLVRSARICGNAARSPLSVAPLVSGRAGRCSVKSGAGSGRFVVAAGAGTS